MALTKAHNRIIEGSYTNVFDFMTASQIADVKAKTTLIDVTDAIQAAIDSIDRGTVFFPAGTYLCQTLTPADGIIFSGEGPYSTILKHSEVTGSLIEFPVDLTYFELNNMGISGQSVAGTYGINGTNEYVRHFRMSNFIISGFGTGCYIQQGMNITIEKGYISCYGLGATNGSIGLKLGDKPSVKGTTTTTIKDIYFTNADTCCYLRAAPCTIIRPVFETCDYGLKSYSRATIINPFFAGCITADAYLEDNGVQFIGPHITEHTVVYANTTVQNRTSFIPDTADTSMKLARLTWTNSPNQFTTDSSIISTSTVDTQGLKAVNTNATFSSVGAIRADIARNTTTNQFQAFAYYNTGAAESKWWVEDSGTVKNKTGTYGTISDAKLKQDIVDAPSQWDDIKNLQIRKYRFIKDVEMDADAPYFLGLVAQEVEAVSPALVEESFDTVPTQVEVFDEDGNQVFDESGNPIMETKDVRTGETTKAVKQSIVYMKALKALQEAMDKIESLEARITALES